MLIVLSSGTLIGIVPMALNVAFFEVVATRRVKT